MRPTSFWVLLLTALGLTVSVGFGCSSSGPSGGQGPGGDELGLGGGGQIPSASGGQVSLGIGGHTSLASGGQPAIGGSLNTASGGASNTGSTGGAGNPGGSGGATAIPTGTHLSAAIQIQQVVPGAEDHVCVVVALQNDTEVWATELDASLGKGSHHLIVDRQGAGAALQTTAASCAPTEGNDATRLMIAQQKETAIKLPQGVAFRIAPHQPIFLQLHYINTGTVTEDITGTVNFTVADTTSGQPSEAYSIFTGTLFLNLPPHAKSSAASFFPLGASSPVRHVFALTSHTHSLGVDSTIERVPNATAPATTPIHESLNWDEPPLTQFNPALDFTGTDGLRLTCNYMNTTDQTVSFGTNFHDEMCFMWVYYYDK